MSEYFLHIIFWTFDSIITLNTISLSWYWPETFFLSFYSLRVGGWVNFFLNWTFVSLLLYWLIQLCAIGFLRWLEYLFILYEPSDKFQILKIIIWRTYRLSRFLEFYNNYNLYQISNLRNIKWNYVMVYLYCLCSYYY